MVRHMSRPITLNWITSVQKDAIRGSLLPGFLRSAHSVTVYFSLCWRSSLQMLFVNAFSSWPPKFVLTHTRYRLIRSCFAQTEHWISYDPFFTQKMDTFKNSRTAIYRKLSWVICLSYFTYTLIFPFLEISTTMHELDSNKSALESDPDKLEVLFKEMIQMCLWYTNQANLENTNWHSSVLPGEMQRQASASFCSLFDKLTTTPCIQDLSLLTHLSPADMEDLQAVGKDAQEARKEFILRDDQHRVWDQIKNLKEGSRTIHFVLDNGKSHTRLHKINGSTDTTFSISWVRGMNF